MGDRSDVLDRAFHALSDPSRRKMIAEVMVTWPEKPEDIAGPAA